MDRTKQPDKQTHRGLMAVFIVLGLVALNVPAALALNSINVMDSAGNPIPVFRWLVEEDKTYHVPLDGQGGVIRDGSGYPLVDPNWDQGKTLALSFHQSNMPIVATGDSTNLAPLAKLHERNRFRNKQYYVSIMTDPPAPSAEIDMGGFTIGGAQFKGSDESVTVYLNSHPIPTAQIAILVHKDISPINGVWDTGEEPLEGFSIVLEDAGGKYGISAGIQSVDVYGNPLCTTYDEDGNVVAPGSGCYTDANGRVDIKNLAPGKYGVIVVPPNAIEDPDNPVGYVSTDWIQTSTIEGTRLIDAWVKANEPAYFGEFGPPGPHVSVGFVPAGRNNDFVDDTVIFQGNGGISVSGQVVNLHLSRPPDTAFYAGGPFPHTTPWVGLNLGAAGDGPGIYAGRTNEDGTFTIENVPPGDYQLAIWDDNLDIVFGKSALTVNADIQDPNTAVGCNDTGSCDLAKVPVFQWFTRMEHWVFNDENEDGLWQDGEAGLLEQNVNLRWRDGTVYQGFPTDSEGGAPFDQVFPFFAWLVAEVDFTRMKATGAEMIIDDGGPIPFGGQDQLNPQVQNNPLDPDANFYNDTHSRVELGPVLSQAFQGFLGQTSVVQWGKTPYTPADEDNPPEANFPGPEDVDWNGNEVIDPAENGGISGMVLYAVTRAENDPELAAVEPWEPGIPNVTVELWNSDESLLLATTTTDSWDTSLPTNCQYGSVGEAYSFRGDVTDCFDGMRNWNQVRPGVFDGGYAFDEICTEGLVNGECSSEPVAIPGNTIYRVKVKPPKGYKDIRSQDKNVDFGDEYIASKLLPAATCVGKRYRVPEFLTLFPGVESPKAGERLNRCNVKEVLLGDRTNAAADFFLFTEVPIAGHIIGFILDDTANEFDPSSPQFGEKYAPPFLPVSIRDFTGREISRTVSDEFGRYNALVPSTITQNLPQPSGISPNMLTACMNSKTKADGSFDPLHNSQYSQFCYTFQYMPGSTTYLDTPVVPVAAFAGPDQNPLDCELETATPRIASVSVNNGIGGGPYIPTDQQGPYTITITSMGDVDVPNPDYDGTGGSEPRLTTRDYGFGDNQGTVLFGDDPTPSGWNVVWLPGQITVEIPAGENLGDVGGRQLLVTRDNGNTTVAGVTVQVGLRRNNGVRVVDGVNHPTIQHAIDNARPNDLILVPPGAYNEMVIMWKPVQLQGWGEGTTAIVPTKTPFEKLTAWRDKTKALLQDGLIDIIPGQELAFNGIEPETFFTEEGAGVFVVAPDGGGSRFWRNRNRYARIDGFTIVGADTGGGVAVNGYADYLEISNLNVVNNSSTYAGGIRVGQPQVISNDAYSDAHNNYINIHNTMVTRNGGLDGAGGGIALHTGSDSYRVTDNFVCGNFTAADGAGIAHYGLSRANNRRSDAPLIEGNTVLFNENFNQGLPTNGGGILIAGMPPLAGALSPGSGDVNIFDNLIQGNSAGAGDGGGIQLNRINGEELLANNPVPYRINVKNNMIINNTAALAGGGIALQDAVRVDIRYNTIANNDNTSTAGAAFTVGLPDASNPQMGAGIASRGHLTLTGMGQGEFSNPIYLNNNIVYENRVFNWVLGDSTDGDGVVFGLCPEILPAGVDPTLPCVPFNGSGGTAPGPDDEVWSDLAVLAEGVNQESLNCTDCLLTQQGNPNFISSGFNGDRATAAANPEIKSAIAAPPAPDEGGNFIRLRYGPLTQMRDYHITPISAAIDTGTGSLSAIRDDFDGQERPDPSGAYDIGADEYYPQ